MKDNNESDELAKVNKELAFQNEERDKRAEELLIANNELVFQNKEKDKRAEELLIANEELAFLNNKQQALFASIVNSSDDAMLSKTFDGIITSWNHGAEKIFGYEKDEIIGEHIFKLIPLHLQDEEAENLKKITNGEKVEHYETKRVKKDGSVFYASLTISPIRDWKGNIVGSSKILRDISERKKTELELIKSNRMYAFISAINQMIVLTTDETSLFKQACNIAVDVGKFKMAWIGLIDEATKKVIPFVHAGEDDDYLTKMTPISIEDIPEGKGPAGQSLREGRYIISNDIENDSRMAPWKEMADERGYLSCISFPITKLGKVVGSYTLYAPSKNFFVDTEIALLEEVAGKISFALENLKKTKLHQKAEEKLKENYALLRIAGEITKLGGWNVNLEENGVYWSDEVAKIHEMPAGYTPSVEEAIKFYAPQWRDKITEVFTNCVQKGIYFDEDMEILTATGKRKWVRTIGEAIRDNNGRIVKIQGAYQDITERKKAENTEYELHTRLKAIFEKTNDAIVLADDSGNYVQVNPAAAKMLGYSQQELTGMNTADIVSGRQTDELWNEFMQDGSQTGAIELVRNDGSLVICHYNATSNILPGLHLSILTDITEQKKAENTIKESEAKYHAFFENSMDGILLTVTDGSILAANPAACAMFRMTEDEICAAGRMGLVDLSDPRLEQLIKERQKSGKASGELTYKRKDGTTFAAEISSVFFTDSYGEERTSMIVRDISERKEAEENLALTSAELQYALNDITKIMDSSLDVICAVDKNGIFKKVSAASEAVWGYKPEELIGKPLINFVYHEDNEKTQLTAANVMTGNNLNHFENRYVRKDGSLVPIEWSARWDEKDQIRYGVARDVTEKKRLEKAFEIERQQFFDLFSEAPSSMGVLSGPDHRFEMANPLYLKLIGKKDIIGKSVKDVLPEVAEQGYIDILDSVYQTGKTYSAQEMLIKLDVENNGNPVERYLNFIYQPHIGSDGKPDGILFFAVDVSEQVLSRKKIEESEARLKEAQALSHIGNWGIDLTTGLNTWSDEFYNICGIKPGDIEPSTEAFLTFIHPEDAADVKEAIQKTFETFAASHFFSRLLTSDGITKYVYSEWRFELDENDNPIRLYGVLQDITERTLAKEKLELTQFTFDHAGDAIFWMTSDARIVDVNEAACHSLGYTRKELLRLSVPDIDPDFNVEKWAVFFTELRKKLAIPIETTQLRKDGSLLPVEIRTNYIQYGNRELSCAFVRDISERKLTEAALIESEQEVRAIAESMPQIVWVSTAEGKNIYLNQQWVDYTGLSLEVSYDDGWLIPFHEDDKPIPWEAWNNAVANHVEYNIECRLRKYDGTYHWYLLRGVPKMNEKGEILKWYGTCTDIEKIKQAEKQLRKSEVFNRSVVNSLSAHLAVVNNKGDIVSINEAWTNFALQNGETSMKRTGVGSNYFEVCEKASMEGDETAAQVLQGMKDVLNKKVKDFYIEYPCHSASEQRWFGLRIAKFESDEPLIVLLHTNITERILSEGEREKITDDLIHRNRDLEQFTYIVSHNLRAPVANIKGLSDILRDESLSKDESEYIAKNLLTSVDNLDEVVADLNSILQVKSEAGKTKERVVFQRLITGIEKSIHSLLLRERVKIITQFEEVAEMNTLKSYLYSIFYNLISNSIKYKRPDVNPVIEIKSLRGEGKIELIFKDNGRGIDLNKNGDHVFGLYKRFHREIEGKGAGLFIVKTQVEALGGKISIESEVNKGTEFKIVFANQK